MLGCGITQVLFADVTPNRLKHAKTIMLKMGLNTC